MRRTTSFFWKPAVALLALAAWNLPLQAAMQDPPQLASAQASSVQYAPLTRACSTLW